MNSKNVNLKEIEDTYSLLKKMLWKSHINSYMTDMIINELIKDFSTYLYGKAVICDLNTGKEKGIMRDCIDTFYGFRIKVIFQNNSFEYLNWRYMDYDI